MSTTTTTPCPPERSLLQRLRALEHANEVRTKKAALKRQLKTGEASIIDVLHNPPPCVENAKVTELLLSMPGVGKVRVMQWLSLLDVSTSKTVGGLSADQRRRLVEFLEER